MGADLTGVTGGATGGADLVGTSEDVRTMVDSCRKVMSMAQAQVSGMMVDGCTLDITFLQPSTIIPDTCRNVMSRVQAQVVVVESK